MLTLTNPNVIVNQYFIIILTIKILLHANTCFNKYEYYKNVLNISIL